MALRELLAVFGIEVDDRQLKKADKSVNGFKETLSNVGQALLGGAVVSGFKSMVEGALDTAGALADTSERLGVGTGELQEFQYAAGLAGVSAEQAGMSLGFLNKNVGEALSGNKEAAQTFSQLGISLRDSSGKVREMGDLLPEVADKMEGLGSQQEKTQLAMQLFGKSGAALLPLLGKGRGALEENRKKFKELGLEIDGNFIKAADDAGDSLYTMKLQLTTMKTKLVAEALPSLQKMVDWFLKGTAGAMKLAQQTNILKVLMLAMSLATAGAGVTALKKLGQAFGLASESSLVLAAEAAAIVAAIVLIALVVEDLYTLFTGGDSVIGDFIDSMFGVGASKEMVEQVKVIVAELWALFKSLWPDVQRLGAALMEAFAVAWPIIDAVIKNSLGLLGPTIKISVLAIKEMITFLGVVVTVLTTMWEVAKSVWGVIAKIGEGIAKIPGVGGALGAIGTGAGGASTGGLATVAPSLVGAAKGATTANVDNKTTININGAGDPQAIANKVAGAQTNTFGDALRNGFGAVASYF